MILVVDTNFVFSGILSHNGTISDMLLNSQSDFKFYSPTSLEELENHRKKLFRLSGYTHKELDFLTRMLLRKIDLTAISDKTWDKALEPTSNIDGSDTPFLALSLELNAFLWIGDKKLIHGLRKKGVNRILDTSQLKEIRNAE